MREEAEGMPKSRVRMFWSSSDEVRRASTCKQAHGCRTSTSQTPINHRRTHNGIRLENRRSHVCAPRLQSHPRALTMDAPRRYNRYLTIASRVVRRSLKEEQRLAAARRGESDLRFAKWEVSDNGWGGGSCVFGAFGLTDAHRMASRATTRA